MKKIIALVLTLVLALSCLAACSNAPAAAGNGAKVVVVGYTEYAPMNYMEGDELVGFDTELAKAVFEGMGYTVQFQLIVWDNRYMELESGTIDCIWNGFTCNTTDDDGVKRSDKVDFSYNYMENRQVVVAKANSGITTAADLNGKIAAVEASSAGEGYAKSLPGCSVLGFTNQTDCLFEVNAETADIAVLDAQLARSYVGKGDYTDLVIVDGLDSDVEYYAIGFAKGSDLTAKVNAELVKLAENGTIAQLAEKYGVANTAITDYSDQQ